MMQNLLVEEGAVVTISSATLPKGTYVKLQPHTSVRFSPLSSPVTYLLPAQRMQSLPALLKQCCLGALGRSSQ